MLAPTRQRTSRFQAPRRFSSQRVLTLNSTRPGLLAVNGICLTDLWINLGQRILEYIRNQRHNLMVYSASQNVPESCINTLLLKDIDCISFLTGNISL